VKLTLLCVGKADGPVGSAISDYEERVRRYWRFQSVEVEGGAKRTKKSNPGLVKGEEEERLLARIPERGEVIALARRGKALSSRDLARFLEEKALASTKDVTFVIGGAFGLGERVLKRAGLQLSLSSMTLPHEIARLFLAEQLYRAGTILRNEPYHKGP
jgi:23S rRNA (pseudouridine1915-N3)-methyltransferase